MIYYLQLLIPVISFMICVIFQIMYCRYRGKRLFKSIVFGTFWGFIVYIISELLILIFLYNSILDSVFYLVLNGLIYLSLSYCYFHFLNLGETARRIRLVRELAESKDGLTLEELLAKYNADEMVKRRLGRLLDKKQILCKDDRYFINNKLMLIISKIIILLKLIILGKKSEFE